MKAFGYIKYILLMIFLFMGSLSFAQEYNSACVACAEAQGFYCGDDESNWTQYAPNGCVQTAWLNDGWEDCVDASDENGAVPTTLADCQLEVEGCDTIYVDIPVVEYDTIIQIEYEEVIVYDTVVQIEYEEVLEYIDCESGLPCNTGIEEILKESQTSNLLYNLQGKVIKYPNGVYIHKGKVKWQK